MTSTPFWLIVVPDDSFKIDVAHVETVVMGTSGRVQAALAFTGVLTTLLREDWSVVGQSPSQDFLGYPHSFWATNSVFDLVTAEQQDHVATLKAAVTSAPAKEQTTELRVRGADGNIHDVAVRATNLLSHEQINAVVVSAWNVTQERRVLRELSTRTDTAVALAEAQTRLLAQVSHELRNPLHVVAGMAELLLLEDLAPTARKLAETLNTQLSGLSSITNDLLQMARLDSGMVSVANEPVHISDLVHEVIAYGAAATGAKRVSCTPKVAADCPTWLATDPARLRQVLRNLVGNAVKFTTRGAVELSVYVRNDFINFAVLDSGVGIPPSELDSILEPFRTGSTAGESKGAGLGLAIVSRLVRSLGGTVEVESALGRGSTFTVSLPRRAVEAPQPLSGPRPEAHSTPPLACATISMPRVLVVEDTPVNQQLAIEQLDRLNMHAYVVETGEEALAFLIDRKNPPIDVVLMDQQLPGISGLETARRIKLIEDERTAAIPVIGLTASGSTAEREHYLQAGFDGFIAKPASMADLREGIHSVLTPRPAADPPVAMRSELLINLEDHHDAGGSTVADSWAAVGKTLNDLVDEFGERAIVDELITSFIADLQTRGESLVHAIDADDHYTASRIAHALKSTAKLFGAPEFAKACQTIEERKAIDISELRRCIHTTVEQLTAWRARQ